MKRVERRKKNTAWKKRRKGRATRNIISKVRAAAKAKFRIGELTASTLLLAHSSLMAFMVYEV